MSRPEQISKTLPSANKLRPTVEIHQAVSSSNSRAGKKQPAPRIINAHRRFATKRSKVGRW